MDMIFYMCTHFLMPLFMEAATSQWLGGQQKDCNARKWGWKCTLFAGVAQHGTLLRRLFISLGGGVALKISRPSTWSKSRSLLFRWSYLFKYFCKTKKIQKESFCTKTFFFLTRAKFIIFGSTIFLFSGTCVSIIVYVIFFGNVSDQLFLKNTDRD